MKSNKSKYKLVVDYVIDGINEGRLKKGAWIPSLNEFREMYGLSRDTVFSGIRELKSRGIIKSNPGVGYYIVSTRVPFKHNIFLLFNEFNEFKEDIYNSFMETVYDGQQIHILSKKEYKKSQEQDTDIVQNTDSDNALININTATPEELQSLSGVGETRAKAIIEYREKNGKFQTIEDIKNVSGIGDSTFENIQNDITVN